MPSRKKSPQLTPGFLEKLRTTPGFPIQLNLQNLAHSLSGHGIGGLRSERSVSITIFQVVNGYVAPLAVIRFDPKSWENFKTKTNLLFSSLEKASKLSKKKKSRRK